MNRKMILAAVCVFALAGGQQASGQDYVRGYTRSSGTYVAPYHRTSPDHNFYNNWSTYPNTNPYTGATGTRHTPPNTSSGYTYTPSYSPSFTSPSFGSYGYSSTFNRR